MNSLRAIAIGLLAILLVPATVSAQRIKDVARVEGIRPQHLKGLGLVMGLPGTGDNARSGLTREIYAALLEHLKINVPVDQLRSRNIAAVMVTASVPSSTQVGSSAEVTISSIGDAKSLKGGWLLETALYGPGGTDPEKSKIYAIAQGSVHTSGDTLTVGTGTAVLEEDISIPFEQSGDSFKIILHQPDFSTATRVARAINEFPYLRYKAPASLPIAHAIDAGSVEVKIPPAFRGADHVVDFISRIMSEVEVPDVDREATVVIDRRNGMVAVNGRVRVAPVVVMVGDVQIRVPPSIDPNDRQPLLIDVIDELRKQGVPGKDIPDIVANIQRAGALVGKLIEE